MVWARGGGLGKRGSLGESGWFVQEWVVWARRSVYRVFFQLYLGEYKKIRSEDVVKDTERYRVSAYSFCLNQRSVSKASGMHRNWVSGRGMRAGMV